MPLMLLAPSQPPWASSAAGWTDIEEIPDSLAAEMLQHLDDAMADRYPLLEFDHNACDLTRTSSRLHMVISGYGLPALHASDLPG